ncbi:MAG: hypothetical protein IKN64_08715 [Desulfovibrio sp.]|nr:hypothetical protein [Desulfovibrio sp.]
MGDAITTLCHWQKKGKIVPVRTLWPYQRRNCASSRLKAKKQMSA